MIEVAVPGSKSITNRAFLLAALARGRSVLKNALLSDDTQRMIQALRALGARISLRGTTITINGGTLHVPKKRILCGNSGTTMRFLAAALATQPFTSTLDGDKRMRERPIGDLLAALTSLGASAHALRGNGAPPIQICGPLKGGRCTVRGDVSSQFLSGLLMAAPLAHKKVTITVKGPLASKPYVDMTIELMTQFGVKVTRKGYQQFTVNAPQKYLQQRMQIEGDASAASYFYAIGFLAGCKVKTLTLPQDSKQPDMAFTKALASLRTTTKFDCRDFPDAAMTLAIVCALRGGDYTLTGLGTLRVKECDRLHALAVELRRIGCRVKKEATALHIIRKPEKLHGAHIHIYNDHRMAMCFGVASLFIPSITIENPVCVKKTYPGFWKDLARAKHQLHATNIILTGMRGTGKSKLGKRLAEATGRRFIDLDERIEKRAHTPITQIVAKRGWKYFRALERRAVREIATMQHCVISTGGGTMMYEPNVQRLKANGRVILLDADINTLKKRLHDDKTRPALTNINHITKELEALYIARKPRYDAVADARIDVSHHNTNKERDIKIKLESLLMIVRKWGLA